MKIRKASLGPEHPDVADSLNNLANNYVDQGRYAEAEPLYKRCVKIREKIYGPEHPSVASSLYSLIYGPEHPSVASILYNWQLITQTKGGMPKQKCFIIERWRSLKRP